MNGKIEGAEAGLENKETPPAHNETKNSKKLSDLSDQQLKRFPEANAGKNSIREWFQGKLEQLKAEITEQKKHSLLMKLEQKVDLFADALKNLSEWTRVFSENGFTIPKEVFENFAEGNVFTVKLEYGGKPLEIKLDTSYAVEAFMWSGYTVYYNNPLPPAFFLQAFTNSQKIFTDLDEYFVPHGRHIHPKALFAQGTRRFSVNVYEPDGEKKSFLFIPPDIFEKNPQIFSYQEDFDVAAVSMLYNQIQKTEAAIRTAIKDIQAKGVKIPPFQRIDTAALELLPEDVQQLVQHYIGLRLQYARQKPKQALKGDIFIEERKGKDEFTMNFRMRETQKPWKTIHYSPNEKDEIILNKEGVPESQLKVLELEDGYRQITQLSNGEKKVFLYLHGTLIEKKHYDNQNHLLSKTGIQGATIEEIIYVNGKPQYKRIYEKNVHKNGFLKQFIFSSVLGSFSYDYNNEKIVFYDDEGREFNDYQAENQKKHLTPAEYIDKLGRILKTPQDMNLFFRYFWEYTPDSPDPSRPLLKGTSKKFGEYFQTPEATVQRVENGKFLGDCEDASLLARALLRRMHIQAEVIELTRHAACVWIQKEKNGKYSGHIIDFAYTGITTKEGMVKYFPTPEAAFHGIFEHFHEKRFSLEAGEVNILDVSNNGDPQRQKVSISRLVNT